MKAYDIIFSNYYTEEHNECMKLMLQRLSGIRILTEGKTADNEEMLIAILDETVYRILIALTEADCLFIRETEL